MRQWTYKMWEISWLTKDLLPSREELCSKEVVYVSSWRHRKKLTQWGNSGKSGQGNAENSPLALLRGGPKPRRGATENWLSDPCTKFNELKLLHFGKADSKKQERTHAPVFKMTEEKNDNYDVMIFLKICQVVQKLWQLEWGGRVWGWGVWAGAAYRTVKYISDDIKWIL
jgi:hypothetical protein